MPVNHPLDSSPAKTSLRPKTFVCGALAYVVALLWCGATTAQVDSASMSPSSVAPPAADAAPFDMAKGKSTFETVCSACHATSIATNVRHSREEWQGVVDQMYGYGLTATEAQAKDIVTYLTATYPARN